MTPPDQVAGHGGEPLTLYCVPHAGGSARTFLRWRREMPAAVRVVPLEIAGRGRRTREPRHASLQEAARRLADGIVPNGRYAILGHSMGGLIAHELARLLTDRGDAPEFLVVAATRPCHLLTPELHAPLLDLPDDRLLETLAEGGTIPEELLRSPMRQLFVPVIRGDLELIAGYRPDLEAEPLPVELTAWYGTEDPATPGDVMVGWQRHTRRPCRVEAFPGGHFFLHEHLEHVTARLVELAATGVNAM
ncbi:thioesterase II family protein [Streptomyces sp. DT24]|uniref:thioesterase II family protein n=1 Tax=Streptomyces sp. DT24 TaxID=3416520 RepID=UPI003CEA3A8E